MRQHIWRAVDLVDHGPGWRLLQGESALHLHVMLLLLVSLLLLLLREDVLLLRLVRLVPGVGAAVVVAAALRAVSVLVVGVVVAATLLLLLIVDYLVLVGLLVHRVLLRLPVVVHLRLAVCDLRRLRLLGVASTRPVTVYALEESLRSGAKKSNVSLRLFGKGRRKNLVPMAEMFSEKLCWLFCASGEGSGTHTDTHTRGWHFLVVGKRNASKLPQYCWLQGEKG